MKIISFFAAQEDPEEFQQWVLSTFAPAIAAEAEGCCVNLVTPHTPSPEWDVVLETWSDSAELLSFLNSPTLRQRANRIASYVVQEMVEKDEGILQGWPTAGIKLIAPWTGRNDVAPTELKHHWDEHVPLANRIHIGVQRYVRNWVDAVAVAPTLFPPAYQGIAFQYFATQEDLIERSFDKPESIQIIADDVADFIAHHDVLLTTEHLIKAPLQ